MKNVTTIVLGATLLSVVACGNKNKSSSSSPAPNHPTATTTKNPLKAQEGEYSTVLTPLNAHLAGEVIGSAQVKLKENQFEIEVNVKGAAPQTIHRQSIHLSESCPTFVSDTNNDGIVDAQEGMKGYGPAAFALYTDLTNKLKQRKFPVSDANGNYHYKQSVKINELMELLAKENNPYARSVINRKARLDLSGKQVVIYGVDKKVELPSSVKTIEGVSKSASVPIACGTLVAVGPHREGDRSGDTSRGNNENTNGGTTGGSNGTSASGSDESTNTGTDRNTNGSGQVNSGTTSGTDTPIGTQTDSYSSAGVNGGINGGINGGTNGGTGRKD